MPSMTLPGGSRNGRNQEKKPRPAPPPTYPEAWRGTGTPEPPPPPANPLPVPAVPPLNFGGMGGGKDRLFGGGGGGYGGGGWQQTYSNRPNGWQTWPGGENTNMPTRPGRGEQPDAWGMRNWFLHPPSHFGGYTNGPTPQPQYGWSQNPGEGGSLFDALMRLLGNG